MTGGDGSGWYRDPADPQQTRYWDGAAWTEHVSGADTPTGALPPRRPSLRSRAWLPIATVILSVVFLIVGGCATLATFDMQ